MLISLGLIFVLGLLAAEAARRLRLPRLVGMLALGIVLGPFCLHALSDELLAISPQLRQIALVIILIRAGLSMKWSDLKQVGRPALLMCFVPAAFEMAAFVLLGPAVLGVTPMEGALIGAIMGAVSPAVVVPAMVRLIDEGRGVDKRIPQLILAGASADDVFVMVLFTSFLGMAQGEGVRASALAEIPAAMLAGVGLGAVAGMCLAWLIRRAKWLSAPMQLILVLGVSFAMYGAEGLLKQAGIPLSGLLAVMALAFVLRARDAEGAADCLSEGANRLWSAAEILLFVLVGAAVDIRFTVSAGLPALAMIALGLVLRSVGVLLSLICTPLDRRERWFCVMAYLPKATVQAAIGAVPLSLGLACGNLALSVAVLAILTTAPLGALAIEWSAKRWLRVGQPE